MSTKLNAISLIAAPALFAISSFFWQTEGQYTHYSVTAGTLLIVGSVFWVFAFLALFHSLKDRFPRYATFGFFIAVYGCLCGGVAFPLRDIVTLAFHIPHKEMLETFASYPVFDNIVFWIGGPAFPSSLLVLGVVLATSRKWEWWMGVLIVLGAVLFPVSRITRIELIAHIDDVLMLIPLSYLGINLFIKDNVISTNGKG